MRMLPWLGLSLAFLSCAGCFTMPADPAAAPIVPAPLVTPRNPPVTADRITIENRHQMADALLEEMDREAQAALVSPLHP